MSYKFVGERGKLAAFDFYVRLQGKKYRERVACHRSAVKDEYRKWVNGLVSGTAAGGERRFRDVAEEYLVWSRANKSHRHAKVDTFHLGLAMQSLGDRPFTEVRRKDAVALRAERQGVGVRPATVNRFTSSLSCLFNWAIEQEYTLGNPFARIRLKEMNIRTPILTQKQYQELLSNSPDQLKPWIYIAIFSGLRMGEIALLRWSQVDLESGVISLRPTETKGKRERIIPISPTLEEFLKKRRATSPEATFVILGDRPSKECGKTWCRFRNQLPWAVEMGLHFHDLRHACATALRMKNVDLHEVGEILGHRDLKTTMRYAHFAGTVRREKMGRIDDYIFGESTPGVDDEGIEGKMSNEVSNGKGE